MEDSRITGERRDRIRVFSCTWGQLEGEGSNLGDSALFLSQVRDLVPLGIRLGVPSAFPSETLEKYDVVGFPVSKGRIRAIVDGIKWADAILVGGGELVQDTSSLLYTPFNLFPLWIAKAEKKPCFVYSVGIGQGRELASWTPALIKKSLSMTTSITLRDRSSYETLKELGLREDRIFHTADSAFAFADDFTPGPIDSGILAVAPRNVSNRQGKLLPLETRKKLGLYRPKDSRPRRMLWAEILDRHIEKWNSSIKFFPFHTGSLSNSDDVECREIIALMKNTGRISIFDTSKNFEIMLRELSFCRVTLGVPLHAAILAVVTGSLPVSIPYASKGVRFMKESGLDELILEPLETGGADKAVETLDKAWCNTPDFWLNLRKSRKEMTERSKLNPEIFRTEVLNNILHKA